MNRLREQVIALAGVAQAARIIDQVSKTGSHPEEFLDCSLKSLFVFDLQQAEEIFGGLAGVRLGLQNLCAILAAQNEREQRDVARYLSSMLYLERQLAADPQMQQLVRKRLEQAEFGTAHFNAGGNEIKHRIAGVYEDTFSRLPRRVKITGSAQHLENSLNADTIRALLLAGVRSAFLWQQLGGRRWHLLLKRRALLRVAQELSRSLGLI